MLRAWLIGAALILASAVATHAQVVRHDMPPMVTASTSPRESTPGWHSAPVTMTFSCATGIPAGSCHEPVVFANDGIEQTLMLATTDNGGHETLHSFVVNVDATPPSVVLRAPLNGLTTTDPTVEVLASVTDATSGLLRVTCNGAPAVLTHRIARCVVPLAVGVNAVVVHALDVAGNSASAGARVTRESDSIRLRVFPNATTLRTNETSALKAATEAGTDLSTVTWRSGDSAVVEVAAHGSWVEITAKAAGSTTITASVHGQRATAEVTVVEGVDPYNLPPGTVAWSVEPVAGLVARAPIEAGGADWLDLFTVDSDRSGRSSIVRALSNHGTPGWFATVAGSPLFGDQFGGLIARVRSIEGPSRAIGRFDRPDSKVPVWTFEALGEIVDVAQTEDGIIYLVEHIVEPATGTRARRDETNIVLVDGMTGLAKARSEVGQGSLTFGPLFVESNRAVYFQMLEADHTLHIARATPEGVEFLGTLWKREGRESHVAEHVRPGPVVVNGRLWTAPGVLLAFWTQFTGPVSYLCVAGLGYHGVIEFSRPRRSPDTPVHALFDAFNERSLYLADGSSVEAIDATTGQSLWTMKTNATPFMALEHEHIVLNDVSEGRLLEVDAMGQLVSSVPAHISHELIYQHNGNIISGVDPRTGATISMVLPEHLSVNAGWFTTFTIH